MGLNCRSNAPGIHKPFYTVLPGGTHYFSICILYFSIFSIIYYNIYSENGGNMQIFHMHLKYNTLFRPRISWYQIEGGIIRKRVVFCAKNA